LSACRRESAAVSEFGFEKETDPEAASFTPAIDAPGSRL
jgi:hypothetical protein